MVSCLPGMSMGKARWVYERPVKKGMASVWLAPGGRDVRAPGDNLFVVIGVVVVLAVNGVLVLGLAGYHFGVGTGPAGTANEGQPRQERAWPEFEQA